MPGHMWVKSFMFLNYKTKIFHKNTISKIYHVTQTGEIPHICLAYYKDFSEKRNLNKNRWTHAGEKRNVCAICMKGFLLNNYLHS